MRFLLSILLVILAGCSTESDQTSPVTDKPVLFKNMQAVGTPDNASRVVAMNHEIADLKQGDVFTFNESGKQPISINIANRIEGIKGNVTISGKTITEDGVYRITATTGKSATFGEIRTPTTTYLITVENGKTVLIDVNAAGLEKVPHPESDTRIPPVSSAQTAADTVTEQIIEPTASASPPSATETTIDLMIVYPSEMAVKYPGDSLDTRFSHLVSLANLSYANSNVAIHLRLVHTEQIDYDASEGLSPLLTDITEADCVPGRTPYCSPTPEPFDNLDSIRAEHGADLVAYIRPFDVSVDGYCGLAWLNGLGGGGNISGDVDYAYAVLNEGISSPYYCADLTLTHELGHNMGLDHDRANSDPNYTPVYPYSYGYGIEDKFGTVMSYINPDVEYFSNPDVICYQTQTETIYCGISETDPDNSANNALSLNNTAAAIAAFRDMKYTGDIDNDGDITLKDSVKSLLIISDTTPEGTIDPHEDINNDGKIGLEEAIYSLQHQ